MHVFLRKLHSASVVEMRMSSSQPEFSPTALEITRILTETYMIDRVVSKPIKVAFPE